MDHRKLLIGAGVAALALAGSGCDYSTKPLDGFDPHFIQQVERNAARGEPSEYLRPLPTTREAPTIYPAEAPTTGPSTLPAYARPATGPTTGPAFSEEATVRMSLQEIVHRAIINNHDVKVAGYQPGIEGARVIEASAAFDPVFYSNVQYQQKSDKTAGQSFNTFGSFPTLFTSYIDQQDLGQFQTGIKQNLPSGGQAQLQYQAQYTWFNPQRTVLTPFYESDVSLQVTQPLLRNFGYAVNQAQVTINRDNQKVSLLEFRKQVESTAATIEKTYWQLVQNMRYVQIQADLVNQTDATYQILYERMTKHLNVSQLQVMQAQLRLEARRATLLQTKSQVRDLSDQLKALMADPEFPVASSMVILPADPPVESPMLFNVQDEIDTALENRFELGEEQYKIDAATVTVTVARNNLLPQLNVIGNIGLQGVNGDIGSAIGEVGRFRYLDFTVGLSLEVPIGNRAARAILRRTELQRLQEVEKYKGFIEQISLDVMTTARSVATAWDVINQSRRSRFAAELALQAINDREKANEPLNPEFVQLKLDTQDQLASAMQNEAQALANYNIALAQLEQAKGTLLKYDNVKLAEEQAQVSDERLLH